MQRLRKILAVFADKLARSNAEVPVPATPAPAQQATQAMKQVTATLYSREARGAVTTLRDLHAVADLSQRDALAALGQLEQAGTVQIDRNLDDAFASRIHLTAPPRRVIKSSAKVGRA